MAQLNHILGEKGKSAQLHQQRDRIREASEADLQDALQEVQAEILDLRTKAAMQQAENPMRIRQLKKMVARIHTELGSRRRAA